MRDALTCTSPKHLENRAQTSAGLIQESVRSEIKIALLTGGFDRPYAYGLAMALIAKGMCLEVIGSDEIDSPEMHSTPNLSFLNLQGSKREASLTTKISRVLIFYFRLIRYAATAKPRIFHILWNNTFQLFDRTLLMLYFKLLGKKVFFTAHNVNAGRRDLNDSLLNRLSLKIQYRLADHIFVHTEQMKAELCEEFGIQKEEVTVIPFGINNAVPQTELTPAEAKRRLGIQRAERTVLFFGAIRPYKGLEHLVAAFQRIADKDRGYRLIVVGEAKKGSEQYLRDVQEAIERNSSRERVIQKIQFIPDDQTELYFKAADVLVLPYTLIYQSGVLFLAYSFGLPVIATAVGSFRDDIIQGETGYLARSCAVEDLASAIETYFNSELYRSLDRRRARIRDYANARNSWELVVERTCKVYSEVLGN